MSWHVVVLADVPPKPWRNGGGMTREVLALPNEADWAVRISVAEVSRDGPFSSFPGVERWFAVLSGDGVRLRVDGADHVLTARDKPFRFDGGATTSCDLLGGATQDLNLMVRGREAWMERVAAFHASTCRAGTVLCVFAKDSAATVRDELGERALEPGTFAWRILESNQRVELDSEGALWMEVEP